MLHKARSRYRGMSQDGIRQLQGCPSLINQSLIVANTVGLAEVVLVSFNRVQRHYAGC